jgi:hypothetical protein
MSHCFFKCICGHREYKHYVIDTRSEGFTVYPLPFPCYECECKNFVRKVRQEIEQ